MAQYADLVTAVQAKVQAALQGLPQVVTVTDWVPHITVAIRQYSRWQPRLVPWTLTIQSGVSQYTLPADWIGIDAMSLKRARGPQHVPQDRRHMVPMFPQVSPLWGYQFTFDDAGQSLYITPIPQASYAPLNLFYFATYPIPNGATPATTVPEVAVEPIAGWAAGAALKTIAAELGTQDQKVKLTNGVEIDNTKQADTILEVAERYEAAAKSLMERPYSAGR